MLIGDVYCHYILKQFGLTIKLRRKWTKQWRLGKNRTASLSLFFFIKSLFPFREAELILVAGCDFVASYNPERPLKFWYPPSAPLWMELTRLGGRCSHSIVITGSRREVQPCGSSAFTFLCDWRPRHDVGLQQAQNSNWSSVVHRCCSTGLWSLIRWNRLKLSEYFFYFFFIVSYDALLCSAGWSTAETHKKEKILTTQNTKAEDMSRF